MQSVNFWPQRQRVASAPPTCATCFLLLLLQHYSYRCCCCCYCRRRSWDQRVECELSANIGGIRRGVYAMWKRLAIGEISRKWTRDYSVKHECASGIWQLPRAAQQTGNVTNQTREKESKWKLNQTSRGQIHFECIQTKACNYLKYCATSPISLWNNLIKFQRNNSYSKREEAKPNKAKAAAACSICVKNVNGKCQVKLQWQRNWIEFNIDKLIYVCKTIESKVKKKITTTTAGEREKEIKTTKCRLQVDYIASSTGVSLAAGKKPRHSFL